MEPRGARRIITDENRGRLRRRADGSLIAAGEERDIADIWADQKRVRLKESIDRDQRKRERRAQKALRKQQRKAGKIAPRLNADGTKDIEIRLSLPKLPRLHMPSWDETEDFLANLDMPHFKRAHVIYASSAVTVIALLIAAPLAFRPSAPVKKDAASAKPAASNSIERTNQPPYATILPAGKTAQELGGWGRVSPKASDPVYAYADNIGGISFTVSEQPLPDDFTADPNAKVASLAKQFNATKMLITNSDSVGYVGTSVQGLQSIVATKKGLLLLIRSVQPITDSKWGAYLDSLQ
jgi:hypothetical protein